MSTLRSFIAIGFGSNLGRREAQMATAVRALTGVVSEIELGGLYESAPLGGSEQPRYLNSALVGFTHLPPEPLLSVLKFLERRAGRTRGRRWGPRALDLDLLLYGDEQQTTPELTLPHPGLRQRPFVLAPLADVARQLRVPPDAITVAELLAGVAVDGLERLDWAQPFLPAADEEAGPCYPPPRP